MNPENIPISKITSLPQKVFKKGNFFLIPLRMEGNEKPIFLRFANKKFKIFQHNHGKTKTCFLGMEIIPSDATEKEKKDILKPLREMEKRIQMLACELKPAIQHQFNFKEDDFHLIKKDRSEKDKIFAKLPFKNGKIKATFWEKKNDSKKKVDPLDLIDTHLIGDVVIEIQQIFISNIKTITCVVKDVLCQEIEKPPSFFDEIEEICSDKEED